MATITLEVLMPEQKAVKRPIIQTVDNFKNISKGNFMPRNTLNRMLLLKKKCQTLNAKLETITEDEEKQRRILRPEGVRAGRRLVPRSLRFSTRHF